MNQSKLIKEYEMKVRYTTKEFAELIKQSVSSTRRLHATGVLKGNKTVSGSIYYDDSHVKKYWGDK